MENKFKIRHAILKSLHEKRSEGTSPNTIHVSEIARTWLELVETVDFSENKIVEQIKYLENQKDIYTQEEDYYIFYYAITDIGIASFYDQKYLDEGKKRSREKYHDIIRNWSVTILLILAILTFTINAYVTIKRNSEIENLESKLKIISNQINRK
ncbi:hypothetical protein [Flavobacterium hydrophilum]|uniref:Uncharacterized protein n=1 Tax=Flavobacterium hydrophilum TaxID=2211445 RepID=A0A2V4C5Q2_9FLAO|nr:hypothetical protein [Flavobacterium hydrophilum]PXY45250.1 hypothetical protein DMB68_11200 [Flavobacterium hydrophilum]